MNPVVDVEPNASPNHEVDQEDNHNADTNPPVDVERANPIEEVYSINDAGAEALGAREGAVDEDLFNGLEPLDWEFLYLPSV